MKLQIRIRLNTFRVQSLKYDHSGARAERMLRLHSSEWLAVQSKLLIKIKQTKSTVHRFELMRISLFELYTSMLCSDWETRIGIRC